MATKKSASSDPLQAGEEPDREVDPPSASSDDTKDAERSTEMQWVQIDQSAILTLPSGASYNFNAGNVMQLSPEDAAFVIDQGYGSETADPTVESEAASEE